MKSEHDLANKSQLLSKRDVTIIAVTLLLGFALWGIWHFANIVDNSFSIYAEITFENGSEIVYLNDNRTFSVDAVPNVVFEVRDGQIAFINSDCPDQVCVRTGFLGRSGQMAACLPNNILFFVFGAGDSENDDDLDIFVR